MNDIENMEIKLGRNLDRLMKEKNLTLSVVAKRNSINKTTLHNYVNGGMPRNLQSLIRLAKFFNLSVNELIFGDPIERPFRRQELPLIDGQYEVVLTVKKIKKL